MDGKKRIARLRNAEKWKKLGFGAFFQARKQFEKTAKMPAVAPIIVGLRKKDRPAVEGSEYFSFDEGRWKIRAPKIPGAFGSARAMLEKLQKKGWIALGSGHYSTVLAHPKSPDKVLKVTRHQDNWIDYVKWASEKGYAGGLAPKVYSWKKFPAGWSWAVMERMERTIGGSYADYSYSGDGPSEQKSDDYAIIFSLLQHATCGNTMAEVYAEDLVPGAVKFVKELRSTMRASDIRGPNTMVRKDGTLCFTDPCAGESTLKKTRLKSGDFTPGLRRYYATDFSKFIEGYPNRFTKGYPRRWYIQSTSQLQH